MGAIFKPNFSHASVAKIPGPPAFVMMATFGPCGIGWVEKASARLKSSSVVVTLMTPAYSKATVYAKSLPAKVPV